MRFNLGLYTCFGDFTIFLGETCIFGELSNLLCNIQILFEMVFELELVLWENILLPLFDILHFSSLRFNFLFEFWQNVLT